MNPFLSSWYLISCLVDNSITTGQLHHLLHSQRN